MRMSVPPRVVPILLREGRQLKKYTGLASSLFSESWTSMHMWQYTDYVRVLTFQTHWAFLRFDGMNTQETLKYRASTSVRYYNTHAFLPSYNLPRWYLIFLLHCLLRIKEKRSHFSYLPTYKKINVIKSRGMKNNNYYNYKNIPNVPKI